jgi:hypothetical protein
LPVLIALIAVLSIASSALAYTWVATSTVRAASFGPGAPDVAGNHEDSSDLIVGWQEGGSPASVWVKESINAGNSFLGPKRLVFAACQCRPAHQISVATSKGEVMAAWSEKLPGGAWRIFYGRKPAGPGAWTIGAVSTNSGKAMNPVIAMSDDYAFVVYQVDVSGTFTVKRQILNRSAGGWSVPANLGNSYYSQASGPDVAATSEYVSVVWANAAGDVRIKSAWMNPTPAWGPTKTIGGLGFYDQDRVRVVRSRDNIVAVWTNRNEVRTRRSEDVGATWVPAPVNQNVVVDNDLELFDVTMHGMDVVLTGQRCGCSNSGVNLRFSSNDIGATWSAAGSLSPWGDDRQVTFVLEPTFLDPWLAEAWIKPSGAAKLMFHRDS